MRAAAALCLTVLLGPSRAGAQARDVREPPSQIGTAVIRGHVVAADGTRALRRVQIRFASPVLTGSQNRTTSTDEDGQYEITGLPAGRYTVTATRAGFLSLRYGQRRPRELGKLVDVADGQIAEHIDFALPKMSVISGRIADEDGEPMAGVNVFAMRSTYWAGRRQLINASEVNIRTDDTGEYRISGLVPGTYVVSARSRDEWTTETGQAMGYAPTYYPGTTNIADSARVTVATGQEAAGIDFALQPGRAVTLSGTALDSHGKPLEGVNLGLQVRSENGGFFGTAGNVRTDPDGAFTFRNVAPGTYILGSVKRDEEEPEVASLPIVVEGADLTGLMLTGSTGGTISGRVVLDERVTKTMPSVRINISERWLGQPDPMMLGAFRNRYVPVTPAGDGTFSVAHVFGPAFIDVTLPDGWMVKNITQDGHDITDTQVEMRSGEQLAGVQITVTDALTTLAGELTNDRGAPVVDGTVVVFAADPRRWFEGSRFVKATRPDQQGRYEIKGLPPGDYDVVALGYVEDGAWNEPAYLEPLGSRAEKVTLTVAEPRTLALRIVSQP